MRLARDASGAALIGTEAGFVSLASVDTNGEGVRDILSMPPTEWPSIDPDGQPVTPGDHIDFAPPLASFGSLWGIGLNYASHAADLEATHPEEPATFLRPPTAVTAPNGTVTLPPEQETSRVTAEGELAIVIGQSCRNLSREGAEAAIAGYMPIIDFTAEDVLDRNPRFLTRAKSYDGFLVLGPWIQTADAIDELATATVATEIDGEKIAAAPVSAMRFDPVDLVVQLSRVCTLKPGDVICTGTPGAGPVEDGSNVTTRVSGIGTVSASVVTADGPATEREEAT